MFNPTAATDAPPVHAFDRANYLALFTILVAWGVEFLCQKFYYASDPTLQFAVWTLIGPLATTAAALAGLMISVLILRRTGLLARATITAFAAAAFAAPAIWGYQHYVGAVSMDEDQRVSLRLTVLGLTLVPPALALAWQGWRATRRWMLAPVLALPYAATVGLSLWFVTPYTDFFAYNPDLDTAENTYKPFDIEALYIGQPALLAAQIAALAPQTPDKPETYALLLGGTAEQSVFRSEVEKVDALLATRNGAGHSLRLVNDARDPMAYPMANRTNLETGLTALAQTMGTEDTAFLYLTSHGSKKSFSLNFNEARTNNMTPDEFAAILDRSGIGPAIIVIGACHAGTFIPALKSPDRLIIAAARVDRSSFGCSDGREWTEFGQSFFDVALRAEPDPRKAFEIARKDVQRKEFWSWSRSSLPQIEVGDAIAARLDKLAPPS
jgi:hypothetical protein